MSIDKNKIINLFLIFLYRFVLDISYYMYVYKEFEYAKFYFNIILYKCIISYVVLFICYIFMPKVSNKPSTYIMLIQFLVSIVPLSSFYCYNNIASLKYLLMCVFCFIIECLIINKLTKYCSKYKFKHLKIKNIFGKYLTIILIGSITIYTFIKLYIYNGLFTFTALNIYDVYKVRSDIILNGALSYFTQWMGKVIGPLLIVLAINQRKLFLFITTLLIQMVLYLYLPLKSFLFTPIAVIMIYFFLNIKKPMRNLYIIFFTGLTGSLFVYLLLKIDTLETLFIRRLLYVPAQLKFFYYDFINNHGEFLMFANTKIGSVFKTIYPYENTGLSFPYLIADIYFNKPDMNSVTGYLGTGYVNAGFLGMIIYSVILGILIYIGDTFAKRIYWKIITSVMVIPIINLNDQDLMTNLLTGGTVFLFVILCIYKYKKNLKFKCYMITRD